jgi:hypothetical protein
MNKEKDKAEKIVSLEGGGENICVFSTQVINRRNTKSPICEICPLNNMNECINFKNKEDI